MRRISIPASWLLVMASAGAAMAVTPEERALLSGENAPVVRTTRKPATPTPQPSVEAVPVPVMSAPSFALPAFLPPMPAGEVSWQEGGQVSTSTDTVATQGNTRAGFQFHGEQGEALWTLRSGLARQNMAWVLQDLSANAFWGTQTHATLGDEAVSLGALLIDDMAIRGGHARYAGEGFNAQAFVGRDRPMLAMFPTDRTLGGAALELPALGLLGAPRLKVVGQDDRLAGLRGAAVSLGTLASVGEARLEADLAASAGNAAPDTGYRVAGSLPWSFLTLRGSHMRQGPYFQSVRTLGLPTGGTRVDSQGAAEAALGGGFKASLSGGLNGLNQDGLLPQQVRTSSRNADFGLSYAPEGSFSANFNLSRTVFDSASGDARFGAILDRLSPEVRMPLPYLPGARLRWDWLLTTPEGSAPAQTHLLTFDAGRLAGTPVGLIETFSLLPSGVPRFNHSLTFDGGLFGSRATVGARGFVEHGATGAGTEGRYGLNMSASAVVTADQSLNLVATLDRGFTGLFSSASWSLGYTTRFGGATPGATVAAGAELGGRVTTPASLPSGAVGRLQLRLDRSQFTAIAPDGRFHLGNVPAGEHSLALDISRLPPGFTIAPSKARQVLPVKPGDRKLELTFPVETAHRLTGRLTDPAGRAIEGAELALEGAERYSAWSNAEGLFVFEDVVPGRYALTPVLPEDGRYVFTGPAPSVELGPDLQAPVLTLKVEERTRRTTLPAGDPFAEPTPAPTPRPMGPSGTLSTKEVEAVLVPHPVVAGKPVVLKVLVRGRVSAVRARLGASRFQPLTRSRGLVWQTALTAPKTSRATVGTVEIEVVRPQGTRRYKLTYQLEAK